MTNKQLFNRHSHFTVHVLVPHSLHPLYRGVLGSGGYQHMHATRA